MPAAPDYCLFWINWWPLCMPKAEWASWVQAVGSIVAICAAIGIVLLQHKLERKNITISHAREAVALQFGALQLIGAVHGLAEKLHKELVETPNPTIGSMQNMQTELAGAVAALGRVDHLRFNTHFMIESLQVAESMGAVLVSHMETTLEYARTQGVLMLDSVREAAKRCVDQLPPRMEKIHKRAQAAAEAIDKLE